MAKKEKMETLNINGTVYKTTLTKKFINRKIWESPSEKLIKAFIPGTIIEIFVKEGQKVKVGEKLLVLEAMKMKNLLESPVDGIVKKIHVQKGMMVPNRALLVELK